jgi:hypothetical protein
VVRQVTAKNRYARALAAVTDWCRHSRHQPIPDQSTHLTAMMRGHYAYYGISGNIKRLRWYADQVERIWHTIAANIHSRSMRAIVRAPTSSVTISGKAHHPTGALPNFNRAMRIKQLPGPVLRIRIVCAQKLVGREGNPEGVDGISHVTH